ncbi:family 43 glycosylhydrolase [Asticcacaulis excentricus]|uniref:Glycoside hydrolase family 43 n=1 Tax=Asticcacaulis excentricus (strain ATCC 15261 / DSM 4724 / KCTC 12464 / NCIMB 9791 / VKM B-1370 / CB 48) TaxID=573065 RepID=E8RS53_ASTEC|nr:family 43 glycosylhydrolase [Asticcacaulis excentricus]ADU14324.1 glycoside hydrolase family 43 [Asticcacaulis excentricus CB 48]
MKRSIGLATLLLVTGFGLTTPVLAITNGTGPTATGVSATATTPADLARTVAEALRNDPAFASPIRGSLTLFGSGEDIDALKGVAGAQAVSITWRSSDRTTISDTDKTVGRDVIRKGAVKRANVDKTVRLTATVTVAGVKSLTVPIDVTVLAKPKTPQLDTEAYVFAYFVADNIKGEQIYFAVSDGNNALKWKDLNNAQPVLESTFGTRGLRDPFIMRSAEGDRFFLLATDLSVGRSGWSKATDEGSLYLEIWESTDLVNWGKQRHVKVSAPNAGMTWAPEATYDPTIDAYVVYWTSHMFEDAARTRKDTNGPQILTSITRDFRTFTAPQPWFKAADLPDLVKTQGMIDSTVLKDGDHYYRFTKVTDAQGCPSADIMAQRSTSLRATTESGAWEVVDRCIGRKAGTPEVEGPSAFIANKGDTSGFKYYVWVDHYRGIGYIPLGTNSLETPIKWAYPSDFRLPARPRHGSVLAITAKERDALVAKWGSTPQATAPQNAVKEAAAKISDGWVVPPVVVSGTRLPNPLGHNARWRIDGTVLEDGVPTNTQSASKTVELTGTVSLPDGASLEKRFTVRLLGKEARRLISYARTPTDARDANQPLIARSVHLALGHSTADAKPLNGNYGVLFATGDYIGVDRVENRGIANPSLFYFADGSLGVIGTRVDMTGTAVRPSTAFVFKADTKSPADFAELGTIDLCAEDGVISPRAMWDSASKHYIVSWKTMSGAARWTTVEDLARTELRGAPFFPENRGRRTRIVSDGNVGVIRTGEVATGDAILTADLQARLPGSEAPATLPVDAELAQALENRFGRIVNTGARVEAKTITAGDIASVQSTRVTLDYSDGSTATRAVEWNLADLERLKRARSGTYRIRGTIRQEAYPQIFAYNRADPTIYKYDRGDKSQYLFIATDDTDNKNVNSPHLPLRVAETIADLADANGGRKREVDLLNRLTRAERTKEGRVIAGCYWAPEIHEIGGRLSILFAPCFNPYNDQSNEKGAWSTVEAHIMQLREGGDPANPADWSQPAAVRKPDGTPLGRAEYTKNISLDMSYFESGGQAYYIWSQRYIPEQGKPGDPLTWIAKVDPSNPTRVTSQPQPIIAPNLSFEENLSEGAFALFREGKIHLIYSSSGVSPTYVVGGVWAEEGSDLTNIDSWHKWKAPLQKSLPMPAGVTDYLTYEQGPGHGAFTRDSDGNLLYVYHSWGNGVGGNGRDTRMRRVQWTSDSRPVLDMRFDEEVAPQNRSVTLHVTVRKP